MHPHPDEIVAYGATKLARGLLVGDIDILINEVNPLTLAASVQFSETPGFKNKRFHDFANDFPSLLKKNSNPNLDEDGTLWRRPSFKIET